MLGYVRKIGCHVDPARIAHAMATASASRSAGRPAPPSRLAHAGPRISQSDITCARRRRREGTMEHLQLVKEEFTRQADRFAAAAAVNYDEPTRRMVDAVGAEPGRVLDVACGPGIVSAALAPRAREVVALDITPEMLRKARERCEQAGLGNVSFREGSATDLPFDAAAFDTVVTRLSIHHFDQPRRAVAEMARVLRAGGRLVVADVVSSENAGESELHNALEVVRDPSHARMLPASALAALVRDAGLTVEAEARWDQPREFEEWAAIVGDERRIAA